MSDENIFKPEVVSFKYPYSRLKEGGIGLTFLDHYSHEVQIYSIDLRIAFPLKEASDVKIQSIQPNLQEKLDAKLRERNGYPFGVSASGHSEHEDTICSIVREAFSRIGGKETEV